VLSFTQPLISSSTQLNHAGPTREVLFARDLSCAHTYTRGLRPPSFAVHPALLPVPNNQAYAYLPRRSSTKSFIAFPGMRLRGDAGVERDGALYPGIRTSTVGRAVWLRFRSACALLSGVGLSWTRKRTRTLSLANH
jgi:hypothetical protein